MSLERTTYGLSLGVLLAIVLFSASATPVAGVQTPDAGQAANATTDGPGNASMKNVTVWTAPTERFVELSDATGIREGMRSGWLTRDRTVAEGDTVVFALSAPHLTATVAATNATTPQAAFVQAVTDSERYSFRLAQTIESTLAETRPKTLNLSATRLGGALQVTPDVNDGTLYVALRTDRASFATEYRHAVSARTGDVYVVNVTAGSSTHMTSSAARWEVVGRTLSFDSTVGGNIVARGGNLACAPVAGATSVAPGTDLQFGLEPEDNGYEAWTITATVNPSGRFFACANTSRVPQNVTLSVTVDGIPDATGRIVGGSYEPTSVSAEREANGTITVRVAWLREGVVALYEAPDDAVGLTEWDQSPNCTARSVVSTVANWTRVATSDFLDSGESRIVRFDSPNATESGRLMAVVHPNRDGNEQLNFPGSDFPVCNEGYLEGDSVAPASRNGSTPGGTETPTERTATATPKTDGTPTTAANGPGFGVSAVFLALVAVALAARGRS